MIDIRYLGLLFQLTKIYWYEISAYRFSALLWIVHGFILPLILASVWVILSFHNSLPVSAPEIISYYLLAVIVKRATQSWTAEDLGHRIKDGLLTTFLLTPMPYYLPNIAKDWALKCIRLISLSPFILLFGFFFSNQLEFSLSVINLVHFFISLILGSSIIFIMEQIVGLGALWLTHVDGLHTIYSNLSQLFSGLLIPFSLMPPILGKISGWLPFQFTVMVPVSALVPAYRVDGWQHLYTIALIWLLLLGLVWWRLYAKGVKNYTAVGI